jgi:uncharacterized protein YbjT (DUF2867 family)
MIFIAGATGFIGSHLTQALVEKGYRVRCLTRSEQSAARCRGQGAEPFSGDIGEPESIEGAMEGVSMAVNLLGIIAERGAQSFETVHVEGTRLLVDEAKRAGVEYFFHQSALGATASSKAKYQSTKARAEQIVRDSGLSWTIFRPSLIIGPGDGFTNKLKEIIGAPAPVIPVPGPGRAKFQPLAVGDWVRCFMSVLEHPEKRGRVYELGGPEHLTYNDLVEGLARAMDVKKKLVHIPMGIAAFGVKLLEHTPWRQATSEQLMLLNQDNICDADVIRKEFGFEPVPYDEAVKTVI